MDNISALRYIKWQNVDTLLRKYVTIFPRIKNLLKSCAKFRHSVTKAYVFDIPNKLGCLLFRDRKSPSIKYDSRSKISAYLAVTYNRGCAFFRSSRSRLRENRPGVRPIREWTCNVTPTKWLSPRSLAATRPIRSRFGARFRRVFPTTWHGAYIRQTLALSLSCAAFSRPIEAFSRESIESFLFAARRNKSCCIFLPRDRDPSFHFSHVESITKIRASSVCESDKKTTVG